MQIGRTVNLISFSFGILGLKYTYQNPYVDLDLEVFPIWLGSRYVQSNWVIIMILFHANNASDMEGNWTENLKIWVCLWLFQSLFPFLTFILNTSKMNKPGKMMTEASPPRIVLCLILFVVEEIMVCKKLEKQASQRGSENLRVKIMLGKYHM